MGLPKFIHYSYNAATDEKRFEAGQKSFDDLTTPVKLSSFLFSQRILEEEEDSNPSISILRFAYELLPLFPYTRRNAAAAALFPPSA